MLKFFKSLLALAFIIPSFNLLPYYPLNFRYLFLIILIVWILILLFIPKRLFFILPWLLIFQGNHPGGRFIEFGNYIIIISAIYFAFETLEKAKSINKTPIKILIILILPIITNLHSIQDWEHYRINLYHFLSSSELEPFFSLNRFLLFLGFSILIFVGLSRLSYRKYLQKGIITSFLFLCCIAFLEWSFSYVQVSLDNFQIWISSYTDRHINHFSSIGILTSVKSLFWNRSWFSMYIISSLPMLAYFYKNHSFSLISKSLIFSVLTVLLLAIGSRGAMFSFFLAIVTAIFISKLPNNKSKSLLPILYIVFSIFYPFVVIYLFPNVDIARKDHLISGIEAFKLAPLSGFGLDSYGWVNENYLRGLNLASKFHSTHNDYLNFLIGNGILLFSVYILIHVKILNFFKKYNFISVGVLSIFLYKNFQEWTYINSVFFPFLFLVILVFRKFQFSDLYFFIAIIILLIGSLWKPFDFPVGYGMYRNPLDGTFTILEGRYKLDIDSGIKKCLSENHYPSMELIEIFTSRKVLDPESRIFCKKI